MNRSMLLAPLLAISLVVHADEGMWTYDNFPSDTVARKYGFRPEPTWLQEAQLSSVRLAGGCSGSFVSSSGLVMTNHHCAHACIEQLSTAHDDRVANGFYAPSLVAEARCPEIELNQLVDARDVTAAIQAATHGLAPGKEFNERRKAAMTQIESQCAGRDEKVRCDVVTLYGGGVYSLYRYRRFQDVRLVFAPEMDVAFFGGDPDNFNFPRFDLDVAFLRVWEDGKPAKTEHHFGWSATGSKEGDLTFVSGNPGGTDRQLTMAQLRVQRDVVLPHILFDLAQRRGALTVFTQQSAEHRRIAEKELFGVENGFKVLRGHFDALVSPEVWNEHEARESLLRAKVNESADLKARYASAWDDEARALREFEPRRNEYDYIERGRGFSGQLYRAARALVRATAETVKADDQRLREYTNAKLPQLKQLLFSQAPVYKDLELFDLEYSLTKMREVLGVDHPFVRRVLGKKSPRELASELVESRLYDVSFREQLWNGGAQAVRASSDPMVRFALAIDADARPLRKWHDEQIEPQAVAAEERIAAAHFALYGRSQYPDATFTPRLSYGTVSGYVEQGRAIAPYTTFGQVFDRATGRSPFKLPGSWLRAAEEGRVPKGTPLDFTTSNDIIGGNSGSPVFDRDRRIVGLIFDGNIHSTGGNYSFDATVNRAIAVDSRAIQQALQAIYGADRLARELGR